MSLLMAILLGFVQGVAEFLPISSSGHLAILQNFFGVENIESGETMFFDVLLHLATLIAVVIVYRKDILDMIVEFFRALGAMFSPSKRSAQSGKSAPPARRLVLMIILGTLPLFLVLPLKGLLESLSSNSVFVGCALLVTGFILFFSDRAAKGRKDAKNATMLDAVLVGCAQAVAVIPGISRSGSTIAAGMTRGFDRNFAVRFSFLLSLPAILGANLISFKDALESGINTELLPIFLAGMLVAGIVGYFSIRLVKLLADKGKFGAFSYYCWAVGAATIIAAIVLPLLNLTKG